MEVTYMFGLGPMELVIVFLIILLVFGAKRIPEIAQGIGKGIMEFKKAARDITDELDVNKTSTPYVRNELKGERPVIKPQPTPDQSQKTETKQG